MKNKNVTYFLLAAVLVVWGVAAYQILQAVGGKEDDSYVVKTKVKSIVGAADAEKFVISTNYRDPFLGRIATPVVRTAPPADNIKKEPVKEVKVKEPEKPVDLSFIRYIGIINNKKLNKKLSLINLNGRDYSVETGDSLGNIVLVKNLVDSIEIKLDGKLYFISKKRN